jgi:transposase-like protein
MRRSALLAECLQTRSNTRCTCSHCPACQAQRAHTVAGARTCRRRSSTAHWTHLRRSSRGKVAMLRDGGKQTGLTATRGGAHVRDEALLVIAQMDSLLLLCVIATVSTAHTPHARSSHSCQSQRTLRSATTTPHAAQQPAPALVAVR